MANFTYIENAHVFSKAPVQLNMEAGSAVNKSVHTVQSNEIWGEVCPFITKETIKDLEEDTLFKIDGYAPVKFNYKKPAIVLDAINNNGMKSNGYVAKVIIDNKPITQFIADTDVTDATGKLATGYRAVLYDKTGGEVADSKYTINYSNGLIYFKEPIESTLDSHYTLSFFTYEGVKLDTAITDIKADIIENANNHSELSEKVDDIEDDYKEADTEINNNISNLSSKVTDNKEKLQIAEANIDNLDDRLIVVEENILDLDENISKLNSTISSNLSDHINKSEIHVSEEDRDLWNKGGNMVITGDNFINPSQTESGWNISLNAVSSLDGINDVTGPKNVPTANAIHNALYGYETTVIPQTYNTVWDNILPSTQKANTGGFYFSVDQTITCNAIEIRQIVKDANTAFTSAHIKIWDKAAGTLLSKSPTMTTLSGGEGDTWDIDEMTFSPGTEYLITFNNNNNSTQFSAGYNVRFDKMASGLGAGYGLINSGTLNPAHEGICPKVILKTIIPENIIKTKIMPEGLYDKHQTHINDTFIHNNAIVDGLYDKTDNVVSYQEGLITYTDGTTEFKDISDSISAQGAFRTSNGITPSLVSFNTRPELVDENGEPTSNRWYDNNYATKFDYEMDANAHSVAINESSSLGSLINGSWMFTRSGLTMFNDDVNCLTNGTAMFFNSKNLSRFKSALPSLTVGQWMFKGCNLKEFKSKLPSLSIGQGMFAVNENLTTFNSLMPNLTIGIDMFLNCTNLTTFIVPPSSLKNLYYTRAMFKGCYNLNVFTGSLEALEQPYWMFNNCKLSLESIRNIANTVKDYTGIYQDDLTHDFGPIGIDCLESEYDNSEFKALIDKIRGKGWALSLQFNKSTQTLSLDEPTNIPSNILYVKKENLGETLNEYIDENLNTWALTYANKVYDLEGWTIFSSVEEAAEAWKLTPINK